MRMPEKRTFMPPQKELSCATRYGPRRRRSTLQLYAVSFAKRNLLSHRRRHGTEAAGMIRVAEASPPSLALCPDLLFARGSYGDCGISVRAPGPHKKILRQVFIFGNGREIVCGDETSNDRSFGGAVIDAAEILIFRTAEDHVAIDEIGFHAPGSSMLACRQSSARRNRPSRSGSWWRLETAALPNSRSNMNPRSLAPRSIVSPKHRPARQRRYKESWRSTWVCAASITVR